MNRSLIDALLRGRMEDGGGGPILAPSLRPNITGGIVARPATGGGGPMPAPAPRPPVQPLMPPPPPESRDRPNQNPPMLPPGFEKPILIHRPTEQPTQQAPNWRALQPHPAQQPPPDYQSPAPAFSNYRFPGASPQPFQRSFGSGKGGAMPFPR